MKIYIVTCQVQDEISMCWHNVVFEFHSLKEFYDYFKNSDRTIRELTLKEIEAKK